MIDGIPLPTLERLPIYYRELKNAIQDGKDTLSSREFGKLLGIPEALIRKDLSYLKQQGRQRVGYATHDLAAFLEEYLGLMDDKHAVLVGVGNLARALIAYPEFQNYGLEFRALFDNDPWKIDSEIEGIKVLDVNKLEDLVKRMHIRIGVITAPAGAAQDVADKMIAGGIVAIWNFAPVVLKVPDHVYVVSENLAISFAKLSRFVMDKKVVGE